MKTLIYFILSLVPAFFIIEGCNKVNDASLKGQLVASKSMVKINEPDSLELVGATTTDAFKWTVSPTGYDSLITSKNKALVFFKKSGTYTIQVSDNGATPVSKTITVNDSVYTTPSSTITLSLAGDQITLKPAYYKSATADSSYIYFTATTTNSYCNVNRLNFTYGIDSLNQYNFNFKNVIQNGTCTVSTAPLVSYAIKLIKSGSPVLADGTYPFNVILNGTTYTGTIAVSSTNIIFNWNYTSGVLVSPKQISR